MAMHLLLARQVHAAGEGDLIDGGGLILRVGSKSASWVFRYTAPSGRRRELGLGAADRSSIAAAGKSLTDAREDADKARRLLRNDLDPIDEKRKRKAEARKAEGQKKAEAKRERTTLARVARAYHERVIEPKRTAIHAREWLSSLERHVPAAIWNKPIDAITPQELLPAVKDVIDKVPETGRRVLQRLGKIFADAEFHGQCSGNAGRAIRDKIAEQCGGRKTESYRFLGYKEVPAFMQRLRAVEGTSARALEFGMLTAARTGEIIGAKWDEIDFEAKTWTVPKERMKGGELHLVHLSDRAIDILEEQKGASATFVFASPRDGGRPISNMAMLLTLRRMKVDDKGEKTFGDITTAHGLCRASFSTWAHEAAGARSEVVEACLAHREADRVKAAYDRSEHHAARRRLLQTWADFLAGKALPANVVEGDFRAQRAPVEEPVAA